MKADTRNRMTDDTSATFTVQYQVMIIAINLLLAAIIGLRFWALRKLRYPRWSSRGVTDMFVLLIAFFAATYFALYYACYATDERRITGVREFWKLEMEFGKGSQEALAKEVEIKGYQTRVGFIRLIMRMVSLSLVWGVKLAFISIHFEFRRVLSKTFRILLYITSTIIVLSLITFVITFSLSTNRPEEKRLGRHRFSIYSHNEYIVGGFDIFTDLLILVLVTLVLRTLQLSKADIIRSLPFQLTGILTIAIATARVICKAKNGYAMLILTVLEGYCAGILLCLPAMRVWLRRWKRRDNEALQGNSDFENLSGNNASRNGRAKQAEKEKVYRGRGKSMHLQSEDVWVWDEERQDVVRRDPVYELE